MNYKRWLLVGYLLALMAFTTSVLSIPSQKGYDTLTTSDSGWLYDIAADIEENNGLVENNRLSHAPYGLYVDLAEEGQPLITVMLYKAVHAVNPSVELMDVVRWWGPLLFAFSLIPIFLLGKELSNSNFGGCAAAFFGAVLISSIYWMKVGAYDREPIQLILGAWTIYLTVRLFKAPRNSIPVYAVLAGLVYGLFGLSWYLGSRYIAPIVVGGLLLILLVGFLGKFLRKQADLIGSAFSAIRENLYLIVGVLGMLAVMTLAVCTLGGISPIFWAGFAQELLGYVGIGGGLGGVTFGGRHAGEMAAPASWSDTIYKPYGGDPNTPLTQSGNAAILTVFVFALITLALLKFCWSRKRWELLTLPWLLVLALLVWPEMGQARFERLWWPFVPVLAGVGAAVLISLIQWLSRERTVEDILKPFQKPIVIASCVCIIATPFIFNAYMWADGHVTPPTDWYLRGRDKALLEASAWLRENTPEDSVVSIQWSYGHLLTGASRRATVCDGCETFGEEGRWENQAGIPYPPDYIYYVSDSEGYRYGIEVAARSFQINGRRIDVGRFPRMGEDEFEWILSTYRDDYGCKIDYVIFDILEGSSAWDYYNYSQPFSILLNAERVKDSENRERQLQSPPSQEDQNYVFDFGENRENVVLNNQNWGDVYLRTENGDLHLDGCGVLVVDEEGRITSFHNFYFPPYAVDIPETLVVFRFIDANGPVVWAWLIEAVSAEIAARPIPVSVLVFEGLIGDIGYLEDVFTSSNGLVKMIKINHLPSLTSPTDATGTNENTPTFRWLSAVGAASFELWVDNDADFSSPEIRENLSTPTYTPTTELADGTYSWRVRAFRADNTEIGWSPTWTFTVDVTPPSAPTLVSPENNFVDNNMTQTFTWAEPEPKVTYHLQISTENAFASPYHENSSVTENSYVYTFTAGGIYYWRVRAYDSVGNYSDWSDNFKLTLTAPPGTPTLSSPADGSLENDNTPTFVWAAELNADNHRLLVDNDSDFSSPVENRVFTTESTYMPAPENSLVDDNYSWRVIAINAWGETSSSVWTFVIDTTPPGTPTLFSPTEGSTTSDNTPTFEWTIGTNATKHRLLVDNDGDFSSPEVDVTLDVPENTHTPSELVEENYWWKVIAIDDANNESESPTWEFTVQI